MQTLGRFAKNIASRTTEIAGSAAKNSKNLFKMLFLQYDETGAPLLVNYKTMTYTSLITAAVVDWALCCKQPISRVTSLGKTPTQPLVIKVLPQRIGKLVADTIGGKVKALNDWSIYSKQRHPRGKNGYKRYNIHSTDPSPIDAGYT